MKRELEKIISIMQGTYGSDFAAFDSSFLAKSIDKRLTATGLNTAEDYADHLSNNAEEANLFYRSVIISYSDFFRNPLTFSVLERIVLPSIVLKRKNTKRKEIRVWSCACAAGQEAYSMAMILEELKIGREEFTYRIFATDRSETQVNEARKGQYPAAALGNLTQKRVAQWFFKNIPSGRQRDEAYTIKPELQKNIDFSVFDLFNEQFSSPPASIFGDFDIVACANLMFYYKPEYQKLILEKTGCSLSNGGFFVAGEAEREILTRFNYHEVFPQSAIFQKMERG